MTHGVDTFSFIFDKNDISEKSLDELKQRFFTDFNVDEIEVENDLALVGIVGQNINRDFIYYKKCVDALYDNNIKIYQSLAESSTISILFIVNDSEAKKAVEVIFDVLF
jgi:aspartate kinase